MIAQEWLLADENGNSLVEFQSFISCEVSDEGEVLKMPTENGGFAAYNKVADSLRIRAQLALQGTDADIQQQLTILKALKEGTQTFSLVTPTIEYRNMTLEGMNYSRKREDGLKVCYVELMMVEVREVEAQYTDTKRRRLTRKKVKNADCVSSQATGKTDAAKADNRSALAKGWDWVVNKVKGTSLNNSSGTGGR